MSFFIEDYFQKYQKHLKKIKKFNSYQEYRTHIANQGKKSFYHPANITSWEWDTPNLPTEVAKEIEARFGHEDRKRKYEDILNMDCLLVLFFNAKIPCYLKDIFVKFRNSEDFYKSILAVFFGSIFEGLFSLLFMWFAIRYLLTACMNIMTRTSDDVKDDLILVCYSLSISLVYAMHALLAPLLTLISFCTRSVITVYDWCNHDEVLSGKRPEAADLSHAARA